METPQKTAAYVDAAKKKSINKSTQKPKKNALGPTAGHGATTQPCCNLWFLRCHKGSGTALWHWTSTRGKNWRSECRPDMIRMIENHFLFFSPMKSKTESPRRRNAYFHSWVTRLLIEMNLYVANIFWRPPANTSILSLSLKNQLEREGWKIER